MSNKTIAYIKTHGKKVKVSFRFPLSGRVINKIMSREQAIAATEGMELFGIKLS